MGMTNTCIICDRNIGPIGNGAVFCGEEGCEIEQRLKKRGYDYANIDTSTKDSATVADALGGKPYFWLGREAEEHNLSSVAATLKAFFVEATATAQHKGGGNEQTLRS